ncbi:hypothetical protein GWK47_023692 [Chionoecetes opilio]|uniref:Uncharacterized protein n=1 Tax=Chionoecetes opilio TaxID=41210 RepID=A0A8J5CCY7_CHIOP|nr:hypothetical protein GWK47_023692 [Chionoecetes opilio]
MEKILKRWISEQVDQWKSNVDGVAIREKAGGIYDHLAEKEPFWILPCPRVYCQPKGGSIDSSSVFSPHNIARTDLAHTVGVRFSDMTEEMWENSLTPMEQSLQWKDYPDE